MIGLPPPGGKISAAASAPIERSVTYRTYPQPHLSPTHGSDARMTSFRLTGLPLAGLRLAGPLAPAACVWLLLSGSAHAQLSFHALGEDGHPDAIHIDLAARLTARR